MRLCSPSRFISPLKLLLYTGNFFLRRYGYCAPFVRKLLTAEKKSLLCCILQLKAKIVFWCFSFDPGACEFSTRPRWSATEPNESFLKLRKKGNSIGRDNFLSFLLTRQSVAANLSTGLYITQLLQC